MSDWIACSRRLRDRYVKAQKWDPKWTVENFLKERKFFPWHHKAKFKKNDRCILKVSGSMNFIADFKIVSNQKKDEQDDVFYEIDANEWAFTVHQHTLPTRYRNLLHGRKLSIPISEEVYYELLGIRNFTQNLRINYKNRLKVRVLDKELDDLLDT